jgi:hypothetical protein
MRFLGLLTLLAIAYYLHSIDERLKLQNIYIRQLTFVGCYDD